MRPYVDIQAHNLQKGLTREIERTALFIFNSETNHSQLTTLNAESDFEALFSNTTVNHNLNAARANGGSNWFAYAYAFPSGSTLSLQEKVITAIEAGAKFEYVVMYGYAGNKGNINAMQAAHKFIESRYGRRIFFIMAYPGISASQAWSDYFNAINSLTTGLVADHVMIVPQLMGNDAGALAGRLANSAVTVADTPARVKTGALVGLLRSELPTDKNGVKLNLSHIEQLDRMRLSTITYYPDYDGIYWGDGVTLDAEGGDFQAIEHVRVVDKVCRRVRLLAIQKIGDRSLNSSTSSIELHKQIFASVMREMSQTVQIGQEVFYGECYPPTDDSVVIHWVNKNSVKIYLTVQPVECPKAITVAVMLDLSLKGEE